MQSAGQSDKEHPYGESVWRVELSALQHGAPLVLEILQQRLDGEQLSWRLWGKRLPRGR